MVKNSGLYPSVVAESGDVPAGGWPGARLLTETIRVTSLDASLSKALSSWRGPWAVHDPGKIMADLAVCVALGGRCLSDVALLRCQGEVFGPVASDPTVCRLVGTLADHVEAVEAAEAGPTGRCGSGCGTWPASTHRPPASRQTGRW